MFIDFVNGVVIGLLSGDVVGGGEGGGYSFGDGDVDVGLMEGGGIDIVVIYVGVLVGGEVELGGEFFEGEVFIGVVLNEVWDF